MDIVIPNWRPAALNEYVGKHWSRGHKLKKRDRAIVFAHAANKAKATGKRRVDLLITLTGNQKQADPDAYFKSVNDALVSCKMLVQDTCEYVELGTVTYDRGKPQTIIRLTDID